MFSSAIVPIHRLSIFFTSGEDAVSHSCGRR
jgi:hypothetical protein